MTERLSKAIQENLIVLLCFDEERSGIIRNSVDLNLFEGLYREIAQKAYVYIDQIKEPPREHIADQFDGIIEGDDELKARAIGDLLVNIHHAQDKVNAEYTMSRLADFIRQQHLKEGLIKAAGLIQTGDIDEAEKVMVESMRRRLSLFDPGTFLSDANRSLAFLDRDPAEDAFATGVEELDEKGATPGRKTLFLFLARTGAGKTWFMTHLGKMAFLQRASVLHVTLEMAEDKVSQRYMQSLFAAAKKEGPFQQAKFETNEFGVFQSFNVEESSPEVVFRHEGARAKLLERIKRWGPRLGRILVKQFPTGYLTVRGLIAYLDALEASVGFLPDLLIVDYPDLMKVGVDNYRLDLGRILKELRGLAVERNMAVVAASQTGRKKASLVTESDVAEDWSKIQTSDVVVTYSQTPQEKELGLARLFVAKNRDDEDKFVVLISQNYSMGQMKVSSARMDVSYWKVLKALEEEESEE